jgi:hypothetical protein
MDRRERDYRPGEEKNMQLVEKKSQKGLNGIFCASNTNSAGWRWILVEWCSSNTLTSIILGSVELQDIKDGRELLNACRMME